MLATLLGGIAGPTLSHVLYAAAGAGLAWWAKKNPTPTLTDLYALLPAKLAGPIKSMIDRAEHDPSIGPVVQLVIDRAGQLAVSAAHDLLQSLSSPVAVPSIAVVAAPAK